ncbi:MAG: ATP-dependent Clp protease adapter ClpS [Ferrimicrobium sp.]
MTTTSTLPSVDEETRVGTARWVVILWDDPVNLIPYVIYVLRNHFLYSKDRATQLTMQVHNEGKAIVFSGDREESEGHAGALHAYGLWATVSSE